MGHEQGGKQEREENASRLVSRSPACSSAAPELNSVPYGPILLSVLASVATFAIKGAAYYVSDSVSLLVRCRGIAGQFAGRADRSGPACGMLSFRSTASTLTDMRRSSIYSSGLEGMLILVAAAGIAWYAIQRLLVHSSPLEELGLGSILALVASGREPCRGPAYCCVPAKTGSIVLEADGQHSHDRCLRIGWRDRGLISRSVTGWQILDPLMALVVAANIVRTAVTCCGVPSMG